MIAIVTAGVGVNLVESCLVDSAIKSWWDSRLRDFMMRMSAASITCLRSSSTDSGTPDSPVALLLPRSCPSQSMSF